MSHRAPPALTLETPAPRISTAGRKRCTVVLAATALALAGCTSVAPLQTASTVDPGVYRLSAQTSFATYCSVTLSPLNRCAYLPRDVPVPEVRLSARRGFTPWVDAGLSLGGGGVIHQGFQLQALADAKAQLWTQAVSDNERHLLSLSGGVGVSNQQSGLFGIGTYSALTEVLLVVPVYYGYQTRSWELVASPRLVERLGVGTYSTSWLGMNVSAFSRGKVRLGVGLDYLAPTAYLEQGWFTLSAGVLWDVGGEPSLVN